MSLTSHLLPLSPRTPRPRTYTPPAFRQFLLSPASCLITAPLSEAEALCEKGGLPFQPYGTSPSSRTPHQLSHPPPPSLPFTLPLQSVGRFRTNLHRPNMTDGGLLEIVNNTPRLSVLRPPRANERSWRLLETPHHVAIPPRPLATPHQPTPQTPTSGHVMRRSVVYRVTERPRVDAAARLLCVKKRRMARGKAFRIKMRRAARGTKRNFEFHRFSTLLIL